MKPISGQTPPDLCLDQSCLPTGTSEEPGLFFAVANSGGDRFADNGRVFSRDAQQNLGGARGLPAALFPITQGCHANAQQTGERGLAQAKAGAHNLRGFGRDAASAGRFARAPADGTHLGGALDEEGEVIGFHKFYRSSTMVRRMRACAA